MRLLNIIAGVRFVTVLALSLFAASQLVRAEQTRLQSNIQCSCCSGRFGGWNSCTEFCGKSGIFDRVHFAPGSFALDARAKRILNKQAYCIIVMRWKITLSGHTTKGEASHARASLALSENRNEAVIRYLVSRGVDESIIRGIGWAWFRPAVPFEQRRRNWYNRRVDTVVW